MKKNKNFDSLNKSCDIRSPFNRAFKKLSNTTLSVSPSLSSKVSCKNSTVRYKEVIEMITQSLDTEYVAVPPPELGAFSTRFDTLEIIAKGSYGCVKKCKDILNDKYRACKKIFCQNSESTTTNSTEDLCSSHMCNLSNNVSLRIANSTGTSSNPVINSLKKENRNNKGKSTIESVYNEIFVLYQINHPNIVKFFTYYDDYRNNVFYLVFEYSCMGPIIDIPTSEGLSEELIRTYVRHIICAVDYIHSKNIVHCDIKPSNVLLFEKYVVKLCDFGSSIFSDQITRYHVTNSSRPKTSLAFQSPELLKCVDDTIILNLTCCDIWSIGITVFCMITGNIPWSGSAIGSLINDIEHSPVRFPTGVYVSPGLEEMVLRMLAKNPDERITILLIKSHRWLTLGGKWPMV